MKILGINIASHDTSAALIVDGKLICAFEEERFNKEKHNFLTKTVIFQNLGFYIFRSISVNF